jgi:hypothetical protein
MKKPTMTLADVQQALDLQNGHLEAAYRALTDVRGDAPIAIAVDAFERLREACRVESPPRVATKPTHGIRC